MSEQDEQKKPTEDKNIIFPDLVELWKEMYFKTEKAWADSFNEYVTTDSFSQLLNQTVEQQLKLEKMNRKTTEKFWDNSALPSKKDVARIAELVISVEEKVDTLDYELLANLRKMADNLGGLVNVLEKDKTETALISNLDDKLLSLTKSLEGYKDEMLSLRKEVTSLNKKVDKLSKSLIPAKAKFSKSKSQDEG